MERLAALGVQEVDGEAVVDTRVYSPSDLRRANDAHLPGPPERVAQIFIADNSLRRGLSLFDKYVQ